MDYEFNNYLTHSAIDEVIERVKNIFGVPGVFFSVAQNPVNMPVPTLHTHQSTEKIIATQGEGFTVLAKDSAVRFGATALHDTAAAAHEAYCSDREFTFVNVVGGTGEPDLLNQSVSIWGRNRYGVNFSTVAKLEDISSRESAEIERVHILAVGLLLRKKYNLDYETFMALTKEADYVRDNWESVLNLF